jgi:hypothetical protein
MIAGDGAIGGASVYLSVKQKSQNAANHDTVNFEMTEWIE